MFIILFFFSYVLPNTKSIQAALLVLYIFPLFTPFPHAPKLICCPSTLHRRSDFLFCVGLTCTSTHPVWLMRLSLFFFSSSLFSSFSISFPPSKCQSTFLLRCKLKKPVGNIYLCSSTVGSAGRYKHSELSQINLPLAYSIFLRDDHCK